MPKTGDVNGFVVVLVAGKPANTHYVLPLETAKLVRANHSGYYVFWEEFSTYALAKRARERLNQDGGLTKRVDLGDVV